MRTPLVLVAALTALVMGTGSAETAVAAGSLGPSNVAAPAEEGAYVAQGCPASFGVTAHFLRVSADRGRTLEVSMDSAIPSMGGSSIWVAQRNACELPASGDELQATVGHPVRFVVTGLYLRLTTDCLCQATYTIKLLG